MATVNVPTLDGKTRFTAYLVEPEGAVRGAIIVLQEIFGVNEGIRRKCEHLAKLGYLALAPDLFWRIEPQVEFDADSKEEFDRAIGLMQRFDQPQGIEDIEATIREAGRRLPEGSELKIGCVGYCLGGRLAFMAAARTDIDASVGYYGVGLDNLLQESHAIARPLMLHIAEQDHFVPADQQQIIHQGLDDHPRVTLHDYAGVDHGFAAEMGERRSEAAARLADQRTEAFFAEHIG